MFTLCNYSLFEICAKIGGQPWAIDDLPNFYECSMAVGYHVSNDIISYVSTFNSKCTRFWSKPLSLQTTITDEPKLKQDTLQLKLQSLFYESLLAFKYRVNTFPTKIFIFTNNRNDE